MNKPGFDLILGSNTMKEFGIIPDFWEKEITLDNISLPMREINKLNTQTQNEKSWTMNNSIYQETSKEPRAHRRPLSASYKFLMPIMKRQISGIL